jgi:ribosomal protein S18 acetylase RimI-like enzyme
LLEVAEEEAARHGVGAIGLNVFGPNRVARALYESAGFEITALQMKKELPGDERTFEPNDRD